MTVGLLRLGHNCNEKCLFCTVSLDNERELTTREAKDKMLLLKNEKVNYIIFTGGEPTVRPDLTELIKFAKNCGMETELQTNAVLLNEWSMAEKIVKAGVDNALVSLHSHKEEVSEKLTNSPKTFKRTLGGIRNLTKLCKNVKISHVINSMNYKDLSKFVVFIRKSFPQIYYIYFGFVRPNGSALRNKWVVPKISDIDLDVYKAFDCCKNSGMQFRAEGIPLCYMQGFEEHSAEVSRLVSEPLFYVGSETLRPGAHEFIRTNLKRKDERCGYCSLNDICSGVWMEYANQYGTGELFPVFISKDEIMKKVRER
jgi:MoaA/NifB/PqqE/SkfB family radical SAM enzyme